MFEASEGMPGAESHKCGIRCSVLLNGMGMLSAEHVVTEKTLRIVCKQFALQWFVKSMSLGV